MVALESGHTSWTGISDAARLGPRDDATAVTADQLRAVDERLVAAGHWTDGDPDILIVMDAGYDVTRLAFVLADLPVEMLDRIRSDGVLRLPKPPRAPGGWTSRFTYVMSVPRGEWWTATFCADPGPELYCDVCAAPEWEPDGTVLIEDEDDSPSTE